MGVGAPAGHAVDSTLLGLGGQWVSLSPRLLGSTRGFIRCIAYGNGYYGEGYEGGRWDNGHFYYNRAVNNVNVTNIHNVYNTTIINRTTVSRVSYNGGNGGMNARPRAEDEAAEREKRMPPVAVQNEHLQAARRDPQLRASVNQGKPPVAATPKPAAFNDRAVVPAKEAGAPYHAPENRAAAKPGDGGNAPRPENRPENHAGNNAPRPENDVPRPPAPAHAKDVQPHGPPTPANTGNAKQDQKYQQQQQKLYAKEQQDHQKLQQNQERDHQRMAQQQADQARNQQMEQKHQQQTQHLEQKHEQQQSKMQSKQPPPASHNESHPPTEGKPESGKH